MDTCPQQVAICLHTQTLILTLMLQNLFTPADEAKTGDINVIQEETISELCPIAMSMRHTMDTIHGTTTLLSKSPTMTTLMMLRNTEDKT